MVQTTFEQESFPTHKEKALVLKFEEINFQDISLVGTENAALGEIIHHLTPKGVKFPPGFVTTAYAYQYFIEQTGLKTDLEQILANLDAENIEELHKRGEQARSLILNTSFPQDLAEAISTAYFQLCDRHKINVSANRENQTHNHDTIVTVRSNLNFIDLQEADLNIKGIENLLNACQKCFASLFSDRAISERILNGFSHFEILFSISIQKMINSAFIPSGKIYSVDPVTGFENAIIISATQDFRKTLNQNLLNPDEFCVFKPTLKQDFRPILTKKQGDKLIKTSSACPLKSLAYIINDEEILTLAKWACLIEDHFSQQQNAYSPMEITWAKNTETEELLVFQANSIVQPQKFSHDLHHYQLLETSQILVRGHAIGDMIGQGKVHVISTLDKLSEFKEGEVLVTNRTDPDWRPIMSKASAIVTDQGGRTCHSAISAREMGIPSIVGCGTATRDLHTGQEVTVVCSEGEEGKVYEGLLPFEEQKTQLDSLPQTRTQILINVGNPEEAFRLASLPCDGVGVARSEFIITNEVQIHPLALVHFNELEDPIAKQEIEALTLFYKHKPDYFVDKMAQGISLFAAAFYPKPVVVRMSDFKSNEYANLLGGQQFEPKEENPMIGWRGASRYYDERYREAYHLECKALKRVRDEMGLINVIPLIPFCRTPNEGRKVLAEMAKQGLKRGENGLEVYVMCEIPSNVILAEQFSELFDGFSIGSNDLTQLILGIDRDSEKIDHLFDERNEAVKEMIRQVVEKAKKHNRKVGICGQAPSDYPDFIPFLVELGIDSISLSPDSVIQTRLKVFEAEKVISVRSDR